MAETCHKVKVISFQGRRVPIMLQDVNGPCPLLAIANVLLLRNQLQLPAGVGEVTQSRLVEMVAGRLLDASGPEGRPGLSEEQAASLQQDLADAIGLLPQLCTGVDVNPRFHDCRAFEYTRETAVFDLLDIHLVHGWLVDPQNQAAAAAVGTKSYNELTVQLVTLLGNAATPKQLTPTASLRETHHFGGEPPPPRAGPAQQEQRQPSPQRVDAGMLSAALRDTLRLADRGLEGAQGEGGSGSSSQPASARAPSVHSMHTSDSMHSVVNRMLSDLVADAFTATPAASRSTGLALTGASGGGGSLSGFAAASPDPGSPVGGEEGGQEAMSALLAPPAGVELRLAFEEGGLARAQLVPRPLPSPFDSPVTSPSSLDASLHEQHGQGVPATPHPSAASLAGDDRQQQQQERRLGGEPTTPHTSATGLQEMAAQQAAAAGTAAAAAAAMTAAAATPGAGGDSSPGEAALREALLVQQFLECSPSQLTYHGLAALHEALRPGQLAVFFRNNHFNTLLKGPADQLFILATDEGFQFESDVVWEALDSVEGDTQLVDGAFQPFRPHASQAEARERQAVAQDAGWATAAAAAGGDTHDADMALAMQLQAEEEERVAQEQRRREAAAARQQEDQRRQSAAQAQAQALPSQRRPSSAESGGGGGSSGAKKKKEKKSSSDCSIQ